MVGLLSYLLVLGCVSVINAGEELPARCAAVSCLLPDCLNTVTPPGECCPVCEDLIVGWLDVEDLWVVQLKTFSPHQGNVVLYADHVLPAHCAAAFCAQVQCSYPVTPPGQCCPICSGEKPGRCPGRSARQRLSGVSTCVHQCTSDYDCQGRQKCCESGCSHFCMRPRRGGRPSCNRRSCPQLRCASQYTPQGQCCPICRPPGPVDCTLVDCADPICPGGLYRPPGQCCQVCLPTGY